MVKIPRAPRRKHKPDFTTPPTINELKAQIKSLKAYVIRLEEKNKHLVKLLNKPQKAEMEIEYNGY